MLGLLANWRLILAGSAVAAILAGWAYVAHLQRAAHNADARAQSATRQASTDQATVKAADRAETRVVVIRERAERSIDAVQDQPGAETPLPDDVRDAWLSGLRELRASPDQPSDPPHDEPAG